MPAESFVGIYEIRNKLKEGPEWCYIGQTIDSVTREYRHWSRLRTGKERPDAPRDLKHNPKLQNAYNKYGEQAFEYKMIHLCPENELDYWEQYYIDTVKPKYNCYTKVNQGPRGYKHTDESRANMSRAQQARGPLSPQSRQRMAASPAYRTPERRAAVSARFKGVPKSDAFKEQMRQMLLVDNPMSNPEVKAKRSASIRSSEKAMRAVRANAQKGAELTSKAIIGAGQTFASINAAVKAGLGYTYDRIRRSLESGRPAPDGVLWKMADGSTYERAPYGDKRRSS